MSIPSYPIVNIKYDYFDMFRVMNMRFLAFTALAALMLFLMALPSELFAEEWSLEEGKELPPTSLENRIIKWCHSKSNEVVFTTATSDIAKDGYEPCGQISSAQPEPSPQDDIAENGAVKDMSEKEIDSMHAAMNRMKYNKVTGLEESQISLEKTRVRVMGEPEGIFRRSSSLVVESLTAEVRNVGSYAAQKVVVTAKLPGGGEIRLKGPQELPINSTEIYYWQGRAKLKVAGKPTTKATCENCWE